MPERLKSEPSYRRLVEESSDVLWEIDEKGAYVYCSPNAKDILGYEPRELIGKTPFDFMPKEEAERVALIFLGIAKEKRPFALLAHQFRLGDGRLAWLECSGRPILDEAGRLKGYRGVDRDITPRKSAEEGLQRRERQFREAQDLDSVGHWEWDIQSGLVTWSDQLYRIYGLKPAEFAPSYEGFLSRVHPEDRADVVEKIESCLRTRERITHEFRIVRPDGEVRHTLSRRQVFVNDEGTPIRMMGTAQDITEAKERERGRREDEERRFRGQQLEALGRLAAGVAHQLNNSLTGILGLAGMVKRELGSGHPSGEDLDGIVMASRRAARLIDQLLTFGRRRRGEKGLLDLNERIGRIKEMLAASVGERVELRLSLEPGLPSILADAGQLEQLLMNLCLNARDAMDGSGTLTVEARSLVLEKPRSCCQGTLEPGRYAALVVADTGRGISEKDRPHVFEPFFTTKKFGEASGLGLSIVHGIAREAGGCVDFESAAGRGTSFTVYFPAAAAPDPADPPASPLPGLPRGRETILVADDDKAPREVLVRILTSLGYTVLAAHDGEEALRLFRENRGTVALAVLDIIMPGLRGDQVFERMRAEEPGLKAIFMSGFATYQAMDGVRRSGQAFIAKPYAIEELAGAVRRVLDGRPSG